MGAPIFSHDFATHVCRPCTFSAHRWTPFQSQKAGCPQKSLFFFLCLASLQLISRGPVIYWLFRMSDKMSCQSHAPLLNLLCTLLQVLVKLLTCKMSSLGDVHRHTQHPCVTSIYLFGELFCECPCFCPIQENRFNCGQKQLNSQFS